LLGDDHCWSWHAVCGGEHRDVEHQFLDVEPGRFKATSQILKGAVAIGHRRLLHEVVEKLADERPVPAFAGGGIDGHVTRSGNLHGMPFVCLEHALGIDRLVVVLSAPAPDRVKVLKAEAERIDDRMTAHAGSVLGHGRDLLTHGQRRVEVGIIELNGGRRRVERHANDVASEEHTTMDRGTLLVVSEGSEQVRMGDHSVTLFGIECYFLKLFNDGGLRCSYHSRCGGWRGRLGHWGSSYYGSWCCRCGLRR